jgi:hypothetical protein
MNPMHKFFQELDRFAMVSDAVGLQKSDTRIRNDPSIDIDGHFFVCSRYIFLSMHYHRCHHLDWDSVQVLA